MGLDALWVEKRALCGLCRRVSRAANELGRALVQMNASCYFDTICAEHLGPSAGVGGRG